MYPVEYTHIIISDIENIDKLLMHPGILIKSLKRENLWYSYDYDPFNTEYVTFLNNKESAYCTIECYMRIKHMQKFKRLLSEWSITVKDILEILN